ncbi:ABC transporter permease [Actinobacillus equuli]|nr:ABC transporter permease [Actinobacillus equuli]
MGGAGQFCLDDFVWYLLVLSSIKNVSRKVKTTVQQKPNIRKISAAPNLQKISQIRPLVNAKPHIHSENCGCGHQHLPSSDQMQQAKIGKLN